MRGTDADGERVKKTKNKATDKQDLNNKSIMQDMANK
jgi:hypothetical protein